MPEVPLELIKNTSDCSSISIKPSRDIVTPIKPIKALLLSDKRKSIEMDDLFDLKVREDPASNKKKEPVVSVY
jgi:hypothetical protein